MYMGCYMTRALLSVKSYSKDIELVLQPMYANCRNFIKLDKQCKKNKIKYVVYFIKDPAYVRVH